MVSINYALREISCKIVYYGPGLSGKTTNLQFVHGKVPEPSRGELISLATEADRTLYFDFLPVDVGQIAGFDTKFQLYTVPGQVFYNATRRLVLRGVDGLVFVADSQASKMDENIESLNNMFDNLKECGIEPGSLPLVFQWNKRDLPDIVDVSALEQTLNPQGLPAFEAVATTGIGVFDTLKKITKMVLENARAKAVARGPSTAPPAPEKTLLPAGVIAGVTAKVGQQEPKAVAPEPVAAVASPPTAVIEQKSSPAIGTGREEVSIRADQAMPIQRAPSLKVRQNDSDTGGHKVHRAQKSLRVRQRRKSFFARLFGWLFGR